MTLLMEARSILYLWERCSLYIGAYPVSSPITQGSVSFLVGIDGPITIEQSCTEKRVCANSFLIPAGVTFAIDCHGNRLANCYLDPCSEDFFRLKQIMDEHVESIFVGNSKEFLQAAAFEKILCQSLSYREAEHLLEFAAFPTRIQAPKRVEVDVRIIDVINIIKNDPTVNLSIKTLAKRVNVSEVTLQRLFKATTGVSIRRFRLWHRLFVTAIKLTHGCSITEAAVSAGFSDAPHFNHAVKSMLGMTPSSIIQLTQNMTIVSGGKPLTVNELR